MAQRRASKPKPRPEVSGGVAGNDQKCGNPVGGGRWVPAGEPLDSRRCPISEKQTIASDGRRRGGEVGGEKMTPAHRPGWSILEFERDARGPKTEVPYPRRSKDPRHRD